MKLLIKSLFLIISFLQIILSTYPVAIFHGIGDGCNFSVTLKLVNYLKERLNVEVKCIEIGNGFVTSWFRQFSKQAEEACDKINKEEIFKGKFSVVGISQGSLIGRYIVQKCEMRGEVVNYVSINGPQMGIGSLPKITCDVICPMINQLVGKIIYYDYFQRNLGPSGYYKDRYNYQEFVKFSSFLADLNNEIENKSISSKLRFSNLNKVLLIKSKSDTVITPVESSWFEFYDINGDEIVTLKKSQFYLEDFIGLRSLDEQNKLTLVEIEGDHVQYKMEEIEEYVVPILK